MNYKLLLDSSDIYLTVGIALDDQLIYSYQKECFKRQSEFMMVEIEKALTQVNISLIDITEVVIGIGPGSYTGVRIALAIAKSLYALTNVKIKAISSLQIMGSYGESYIALMNARSERSYIGVYSNGECLLSDCVKDNKEAKELINQYSKKGFHVRGDIDYLDLNGENYSLVDGLFSNEKHVEEVKVIDSLTPKYLKENY